MTAHVSHIPPTAPRRENIFVTIEREGRDAYRAGLTPHACKYNGVERRAWLIGYEAAKDMPHAESTTP